MVHFGNGVVLANHNIARLNSGEKLRCFSQRQVSAAPQLIGSQVCRSRRYSFTGAMADAVADTRRLYTKPQNLSDAYGPPSNFLEIDVSNPETVGVGRGRFTTYEIRLKVSWEQAAASIREGVH